ncbi:hypothetical protein JTB14_006362 [Gonioctena quinquepunctata]|nr:hypothetical protein JTB14_006362 [Gonioctena quinquepunctata]
MFIPGLPTNLLSVSKLISKGYVVIFYKDRCRLLDNNVNISVIATATNVGGIYRLNTSAFTPMESNLKSKYPAEDERKNDSDIPYRNLIGCLMYIAINTRPDIAHVSSVLSQFNNCYTEEHWKYAKRILRYLKSTKDCCAINPLKMIP